MLVDSCASAFLGPNSVSLDNIGDENFSIAYVASARSVQ